MKLYDKNLIVKLRRITYLWVILLVLSLFLVYLAFSVTSLIHSERMTRKDELSMIDMGIQLRKGSDFLTEQARRFAVTASPKALNDYWHEVNILKNRDKAVQHLKLLSAKEDEILLLEKSKLNSDKLINTEARSMRLMMDAYNISPDRMPLAVKSYLLSAKDAKLSNVDKVLLAQKILFDPQYSFDKSLIMKPIQSFEFNLRERVKAELKKDIRLVNFELYLLIIISIIITTFILAIIYIRSGLLSEENAQ